MRFFAMHWVICESRAGHAGAISKDNCSVVFSSISDLRWFTRSNVSGVDSIAEEIWLCSG